MIAQVQNIHFMNTCTHVYVIMCMPYALHMEAMLADTCLHITL